MKQTTDANYIQQLITEGEHVHQDFKFAISDARKIAKSLSAFANTGGGRLLIGVKDNGKIAGIRSEEELYMIEAAATMYCKPALQLDNRLYKVEGKDVLEVYVPESKSQHSDGRCHDTFRSRYFHQQETDNRTGARERNQ